MDLIKTALEMGFSDAAVMDTDKFVFVPEYRQFCVDNLCGTLIRHARRKAVQ